MEGGALNFIQDPFRNPIVTMNHHVIDARILNRQVVVVTYYREAIVNNNPPLVAAEASTGFSMVGVPDPFFPSEYKRKKWAGYARLTTYHFATPV